MPWNWKGNVTKLSCPGTGKEMQISYHALELERKCKETICPGTGKEV
jgi:hypothetical protein